MNMKSRRAKLIAGIAAVAVLVIVLLITVGAEPNNDAPPQSVVLATVDGEPITASDVVTVQIRMYRWDGVWKGAEEILEQLIAEKLLFREAEKAGNLPTMADAEEELLFLLLELRMSTEVFEALLQEEGISYDEYLEYRWVQMSIRMYIDAIVPLPEVTEEEIMKAYEAYRELWSELYPDEEPPPFEEMRSRIELALQQEKQQDAIYLLIEELRDNADIIYIEDDGLPL